MNGPEPQSLAVNVKSKLLQSLGGIQAWNFSSRSSLLLIWQYDVYQVFSQDKSIFFSPSMFWNTPQRSVPISCPLGEICMWVNGPVFIFQFTWWKVHVLSWLFKWLHSKLTQGNGNVNAVFSDRTKLKWLLAISGNYGRVCVPREWFLHHGQAFSWAGCFQCELRWIALN